MRLPRAFPNSLTLSTPSIGSRHRVVGSCSLPATRAGEALLTWAPPAGATPTTAERSTHPRLLELSTWLPSLFSGTPHAGHLLRGHWPTCDQVFVLAGFTRGRQPCEERPSSGTTE